MKLRTLQSWLLIVVMLGLAVAPSFAQAVAASPQNPEARIHEFYHWYVHALNQNKNPLTGQRIIMRKYVTVRLLREIDRMAKGPDGLDGDYFIDAQDWNKKWEQNIAISNVNVKAATATATVALTGEMNRHLKVTLKQEGGAWKVDRVVGMDK